MKDKSGGCYVPVSTAVSVLGVLGLEPAFPSEEPCMAVTCTNPLSLVLNSYAWSTSGPRRVESALPARRYSLKPQDCGKFSQIRIMRTTWKASLSKLRGDLWRQLRCFSWLALYQRWGNS